MPGGALPRPLVGARGVEYAPLAAMALPNKTKIPVGTVLAGKYKITREIGRGGMAAVYEAENVDIGKRVAIKVLAQELTTSVIVVERFLREARAAAAIRSPYICDVYDSGKLDDGRPFLVLELLEGESLYERMTKIRFLDPETTIAVIAQTCRGLTKAHAASIVHRDLKPENIFLTKDEEGKLIAKILDFGLAKFYAPVSGSAQQARLTREGAVFGTPAYMSPEQVRGQGAVDDRADLWALGCIVYECLTGRTVWSTEQGVAMTFAQIANAPLPNPQQYRPDLPDKFTAWFNQALDRDIDKRYQTAKEFAEEFAAAFHDSRASLSGIIALSSIQLPDTVPAPPMYAPAPVDNPFLPSPKRVGDEPPPDSTIPVDLRDSSAQDDPAKAAVSQAAKPPVTPMPVGMGESPTSTRASKLGFEARVDVDLTPSGNPYVKTQRPLGRAVVIVAAAAVLGGGAYAGWTQFIASPGTPLVQNSATASGSAPPPPISGSPQPAGSAIVAALPWMAQVRDAQQLIASGDLKSAAKLLKDAFDKSAGHGVPRTMGEHLKEAMSGASDKAPCRLAGLARPRTYDLVAGQTKAVAVGAGRPAIIVGPSGPVMAWTDPHEGPEHAYTVALDEAMRVVAQPVDVTPEGIQIGRPELSRVDSKLVITYWDSKGSEAGVKVRLLEGDGRIAGPQVGVAPASSKGSGTYPSIARGPDGSFYIAWSTQGDNDSEDIFLRRLSATLEPQGDVIRATDFVPAGPMKPRARLPSLAVGGGALQIAFKLERDQQRSFIQRIRLPFGDAGKGLEPEKKGAKKADRTIGELSLVNTDKAKADSPALSCGVSGCFVTWHGDGGGGAWEAVIDPTKAQPTSRHKVGKAGGRPAVAIAPSGQAQVVWFEQNTVLTATLNRDGDVGTAVKIGRVVGDKPTPSLVAGSKPGEWYVAWLDYEAGHLEPYAARVLCK